MEVDGSDDFPDFKNFGDFQIQNVNFRGFFWDVFVFYWNHSIECPGFFGHKSMRKNMATAISSGQIIETSHDLTPKGS